MNEVYRQAPIISLRMIRDSSIAVPQAVRSPGDMAQTLMDKYGLADRELMIVIHLDTRHNVLAIEPTSTGGLNSCHITLREMFKGAILSNAAAIIIAHNHPSGNILPSPEDVHITKAIVEAGELLDIEVVDHIVFSDSGWVSLRERGLGFS